MKITRLELQAFGPFFQKEEILFSELYDSSIFLISGKTGSGKTTLFDAICFGLYGETSADRDTKSLKSDFSVELETYVIIEFLLDNVLYKVKRYPGDQRIKTERGSRTLKNQEVSLVYGDKVIDGVTDVRAFIVKLLGVNAEQFKKIVMLPQGKFKELLFANTNEKGEIFRTIFGTQRLSLIMNNIRTKYNDTKREYEDISRDRERLISEFICEENFTVEEQINKDISLLNDMNLEIDILNLNITTLTGEINQSIEINEKIEMYNIARKSLNELESKRNSVDVIRNDLELSIQARENKKLFDSVNTLVKDIEETKVDISDNEIKLNSYVQKSESIKVSEESIAELRTNITNLNNTKNNLDAVSNLHVKHNETRSKLEEKMREKDNLSNKINNITVTDEKVKNTREEVAKLEKELVRLQDLASKIKEYDSVNSEFKRSVEKCSEYIKLCDEASTNLNILQNSYNNELASKLALELEPNEPCPVCGSQDHPCVATFDSEIVSKDVIDKHKLEKEMLEKKLTVHETKRDTYQAEICKLKEEIELFGIEHQTIDGIEKSISDMNLVIKKKQVELLECEKEIQYKRELSDGLSGLLSAIEVFQSNIDDITSELQSINTGGLSYENTIQQLQDVVTRTEMEKINLENLEKLFKEKADINKEITSLKSQLEVQSVNLAKMLQRLEVEQSDFDNVILNKFSSNIDLFANYLNIDVEKLESEINKYTSDVTKYETTLINFAEFKDRTIMDIDMQKNQLAISQRQLAELKREIDIINSRNILNSKNNELLTKLDQQLLELEKEYKITEKIHNVAQGKFNSGNINFETHVLAVFYEEVLELTNNKLKDLTRGRYQLKRKVEKSGGGKQGLDTTIFDLTTGRERGISSVSGGESFMISLALALSLSEITQMNSNCVDIETLFIDEGFGTLDPEALEITIDLLLRLNQDGKLVGIISHVKELQDRISAKVLIETSKMGSYIKEVIY